MKTQTITLTHLPDILLVELPEGATNHHIHKKKVGSRLRYTLSNGINTSIELPQGNWQIVSTLADLTEQQAHGLVDWDEDELYYKVYDAHPITHDNGQTTIRPGCLDAFESFHSAIRASGWYLENPVKVHTWASENADDYKKQYDAAQSRVLCRERTLILRRVR